jgi:serine/threonine protein phosphatase PrpC
MRRLARSLGTAADPDQAARGVVDAALRASSLDNATAMAVFFSQAG